MSGDFEKQVSVEDRDLGPRWHLRAVLIIAALLGVAYVLAAHFILDAK